MKAVKMQGLLLCILFLCNSCARNVDKSKLTAYNCGLYYDTPVWKLAKAVRHQNVARIKKLITVKKTDPNYQEPIMGETVLMYAILTQKYKSCEALLKAGADPNIHETSDGSSAIIEAARISRERVKDDNTRFLKLLLSYGANPSDIETGVRREGNSRRDTPLIAASSDFNYTVSPLAKVKLLVEAGADINYINEFGTSALTASTFNLDVMLYLLQQGADYTIPFYTYKEQNHYILEILRLKKYSLDSKNYQYKMAIVAFLKEKGLDYWAEPIPESVIKDMKQIYPDTWEEYLKTY